MVPAHRTQHGWYAYFYQMLFREVLPSSGILTVNGRDVIRMANKEVPYLRRSLGVIFQDYRLLPEKTVYENISFAMQVIEAPRRLMQRSVNSVLDIVGLRDKYKCFPHQLSGGEQQRVAIARAIVNNPAILLMSKIFFGVFMPVLYSKFFENLSLLD